MLAKAATPDSELAERPIVLTGFSWLFLENTLRVPQIRAPLLLATSFPIPCSLIILYFYTMFLNY
jgi:hypothetical protein